MSALEVALSALRFGPPGSTPGGSPSRPAAKAARVEEESLSEWSGQVPGPSSPRDEGMSARRSTPPRQAVHSPRRSTPPRQAVHSPRRSTPPRQAVPSHRRSTPPRQAPPVDAPPAAPLLNLFPGVQVVSPAASVDWGRELLFPNAPTPSDYAESLSKQAALSLSDATLWSLERRPATVPHAPYAPPPQVTHSHNHVWIMNACTRLGGTVDGEQNRAFREIMAHMVGLRSVEEVSDAWARVAKHLAAAVLRQPGLDAKAVMARVVSDPGSVPYWVVECVVLVMRGLYALSSNAVLRARCRAQLARALESLVPLFGAAYGGDNAYHISRAPASIHHYLAGLARALA